MIKWLTYSWCEAVTRRIVDSREMTRSSEDVYFIVVSATQSLATGLLPVCWTIFSHLIINVVMHVNVTSFSYTAIFRTDSYLAICCHYLLLNCVCMYMAS